MYHVYSIIHHSNLIDINLKGKIDYDLKIIYLIQTTKKTKECHHHTLLNPLAHLQVQREISQT